MNHVRVDQLFSQVVFTKNGAAIKEAGSKKIYALTSKIAERMGRIEKIRQEYGITDRDLIQLLQLAMRDHGARMYTLASNVSPKSGRGNVEDVERTIPGGVVQNLMSEQEAIEQEQSQLERLNLVCRNIDETANHKLSYTDLEYLGF